MRAYVGTSGWAYPSWNPDASLDWYVRSSGLNAVELNASFYRFPYPNQVLGWARKGRGLRWAVKVHRFVTHVYRFRGKAHASWRNFRKLFEPLDRRVDFYLFQLPPSAKPSLAPAMKRFFDRAGLGRRAALEVRSEEWFSPRWVDWAAERGVTWVSIDAPEFSREIFNTSGSVYLRMHGRTGWYRHSYTDAELEEKAAMARATGARRLYVFFNNNHDMLENARAMRRILSARGCARP
ncbi:MAG: DUF72 domain-containing protein [Thermoplasmatota archaeon]